MFVQEAVSPHPKSHPCSLFMRISRQDCTVTVTYCDPSWVTVQQLLFLKLSTFMHLERGQVPHTDLALGHSTAPTNPNSCPMPNPPELPLSSRASAPHPPLRGPWSLARGRPCGSSPSVAFERDPPVKWRRKPCCCRKLGFNSDQNGWVPNDEQTTRRLLLRYR